MANMFDFYFRQLVTEGEIDAALDALEAADRRIVEDLALHGIILGGNVIENSPTPNLTVNVEGPVVCYDQLGRRVAFLSSTQNKNVAVDENGAPTAVTPASGNERVVSIFIEFDRFLTDPREDGTNQTVFYSRAEGFQLNVVQGAEYTPPAMPALPPLRSDQLLLCDITLTDGMSQIFNADIDAATRREDAFRLTGAPFSSTRGRIKDALQDIADELNAISASLSNTISSNLTAALLIENFAPTANGGIQSAATTATARVSFPNKVGDVLRGMRAFGSDTGLNGTIKLFKRLGGDGNAPVEIGALDTFPGTEGARETIFGSPETIVADTNYYFLVQTGAGAGLFVVEYLGLLVP